MEKKNVVIYRTLGKEGLVENYSIKEEFRVCLRT